MENSGDFGRTDKLESTYKYIMNHIQNIGVCALLIWAGFYVYNDPNSYKFIFKDHVSGIMVLSGVVLFSINIIITLQRLSRIIVKKFKILLWLFVLIYIIVFGQFFYILYMSKI